jgi:hypothetical protein
MTTLTRQLSQATPVGTEIQQTKPVDTSLAETLAGVASTGVQFLENKRVREAEAFKQEVQQAGQEFSTEITEAAFGDGSAFVQEGMQVVSRDALKLKQGKINQAEFMSRASAKVSELKALNPTKGAEIDSLFAQAAGFDPRASARAIAFGEANGQANLEEAVIKRAKGAQIKLNDDGSINRRSTFQAQILKEVSDQKIEAEIQRLGGSGGGGGGGSSLLSPGEVNQGIESLAVSWENNFLNDFMSLSAVVNDPNFLTTPKENQDAALIGFEQLFNNSYSLADRAALRMDPSIGEGFKERIVDLFGPMQRTLDIDDPTKINIIRDTNAMAAARLEAGGLVNTEALIDMAGVSSKGTNSDFAYQYIYDPARGNAVKAVLEETALRAGENLADIQKRGGAIKVKEDSLKAAIAIKDSIFDGSYTLAEAEAIHGRAATGAAYVTNYQGLKGVINSGHDDAKSVAEIVRSIGNHNDWYGTPGNADISNINATYDNIIAQPGYQFYVNKVNAVHPGQAEQMNEFRRNVSRDKLNVLWRENLANSSGNLRDDVNISLNDDGTFNLKSPVTGGPVDPSLGNVPPKVISAVNAMNNVIRAQPGEAERLKLLVKFLEGDLAPKLPENFKLRGGIVRTGEQSIVDKAIAAIKKGPFEGQVAKDRREEEKE